MRLDSLIEINSVDAAALARRLQINLRLAQRIVSLRPYSTAGDLHRVWGLDDETLERILPLVSFNGEPGAGEAGSLSLDTAAPSEKQPGEEIPPLVAADPTHSDHEPSPAEEQGEVARQKPDRKVPVQRLGVYPVEDLDQAEKVPAPAPATAASPGPLRRTMDRRILLLLGIILAVGAYLRFTGLNWDDNTHQHPDERFITMTAEKIKPVSSLAEYFDTANSSLNPMKLGSYTYGMLPLFLARSVAEQLDMTHYDKIHLVGRALSGVFDLAAVLLLYLLGSRLYGRKTGLLAAALASAAVLPIQLSHYFAVDSFSTVFVVAAFILAYQAIPIDRAGERPRWSNLPYFALFGLSVGAAMASKVNTAPVFGIIGIAGAAHLITVWKQPAERKAAIWVILTGWVLALLGTALAFRVFQPYAFNGPGFFGLTLNQRWLDVIKEVTNQVAGNSEWPPNHHWTQRGITYAWTNIVFWGLGLPLGLAAWAGWGWAGWRIWKGDWRRHLLPFLWVGAYFLWQNAQFWRYMRYFIPIYPFLILFGAHALVVLYRRTRPSRARLAELARTRSLNLGQVRKAWPGLAGVLAAVIVVGGTYLYAFVFLGIYQEPITRVAASRWMIANIAGPMNVTGSSTLGETSYPVSIELDRALNPGETGKGTFSALQTGTTSQIRIPHPSLAAADIHFWLRKGEGAGELVSEGHLILPGEARSGEMVVALDEAELEAGQTYNLRYIIYASGPVIAGTAELRGDDPAAPGLLLDLKVDLGETRFKDSRILLKPAVDMTVTRLVIADLQAQPVSGETTLQVKLSRDQDGHDVLGMAALTVDMLAPEGKDALVFSFPEVTLNKGGKYTVSYKLLKGGPLVMRGETYALETSWDDALPLPVDGYSPLGGIYSPLNLQLYEPDSPEKLQRMVAILDQVDYLVLPSNRAYDAMPRLPLRYPLSTRYYQALFNCMCTGDAMEARANGLKAGFQSPLGFELVASFEHPLNFGIFSISDLSADEAFTVYDHPKVMIFKKTAEYSPENVRAILEAVDLTQIIDQGPMAYTKMPTGLRLPADRLAAQKAGGTWSKMFNRQALFNQNQGLGAAAWYLLIALFGLAAFPVVFAAFPGLKDRGYPISRILGLVFTAWLAWFLASLRLAAFTNLLLGFSSLLLAGLGVLFARRHWQELRAYLRERWLSILGVEILFLGLFTAAVLVRMGNPDLWNPWLGGEKPMDFAFFNAVLKAVSFPPEHPWFSGNYINYYYYGYVLAAVPTRLLGMLPSIAFNLVLPTWFAFSGLAIFSAAYNLASARKDRKAAADGEPTAAQDGLKSGKARLSGPAIAGLAAVVLTLLLGNLYQVRQLVKYLPDVAAAEPGAEGGGGLQAVVSGAARVLSGEAELPGDKGRWYFGPSRPILHDGPDTPIAEFPLFTFLYGDMHPHLLAMPVLIAALVWILAWLLRPPGPRPRLNTDGKPDRAIRLDQVAVWVIGGLAIGMLRPAHTWDYPTLLGLGGAALAWDGWKRRQDSSRGSLLRIAARLVLLALLSQLLYQPFSRWFGTAYSSLEIWKGARTPLGDYLSVHGLFLFVMVSYLLLLSAGGLKAFWQRVQDVPVIDLPKGHLRGILLAMAGLLAASFVWYAGYQVIAVGLPLLAWLAGVTFRRGRSLAEAVTLALFAAGLGATLVVEVVVLKGDVGRANMVFRYYNQAWIFFSLASAAALVSLLERWPAWRLAGRILWTAGLGLLALGALLYPLTAVPLKIADRWPGIENPPRTLDGAAYMLGEAGQSLDSVSRPAIYDDNGSLINLAGDAAGIQYLQENATGTPVIVEAQTVEYRWGSRFSVYTGLPAVVGWSWHVRQHNSILPGELVEKRIREVTEFYNTPDLGAAETFLQRYGVGYIIVGDMERAYYTAGGLEKFRIMAGQGRLAEVFHWSSGTSQLSIYQVMP